jgi:hypothetical protein
MKTLTVKQPFAFDPVGSIYGKNNTSSNDKYIIVVEKKIRKYTYKDTMDSKKDIIVL